MSDAFKNYENLLSSLDQARNEAANTNITYHQTKAGVDNTAKILGETKLFLSGKPALQKISKNIAKPLYEKYGKEFIDNKVTSLKNKLGFKETPKPESSPSGENDNTTGSSDKPPVDEGDETPQELNDRLLGEQGLRESSAARIDKLTAEDSARTSEVNDIVERGAQRSRLFEKRVGSGDAEGEELIEPIRNMQNPFANNLEDFRNSNLTDFSQPKTSFTSEDLGAKGVASQEYDRSTGLTSEESATIENYSNIGLRPSELRGYTMPDRSGTFDSSVAKSRTINDSGTSSSADVDNLQDKAAADKAVADKAKADGEDGDLAAGGEDAAIDAGAEAGAGILDAIPGMDIVGVIGGAIIAGVMEHKEKKDEEAEKDVTAASGVDTQIGLGGSEALN